MSESVFRFRTRGGSIQDNKPRVYFTCHPDDFGETFESISDTILEVNDCAIFVTADLTADINDENILVDLERMNLFVIPVTRRLLTTKNRAMDFDFRFAREKNIPVLPLIMETGIYELYKDPDNFGEMQYLNPNDKDDTAIEYKKKLKKLFDTVLFSEELVKEIRKEFDSYIFLSYRKKDRRLANELMKIIHNNPEFQDLAIWFDEYLTPGESFRDNISKVLYSCGLFALLVTPSLLERSADGSPNFIMDKEYPAAKELGKPILPAEMQETDKSRLEEEFKGIPECTDAHDTTAFYQNLLEALKGIVKPENNDDPKHLYLIGMAYLKGIDVEVDIEKGLSLITRAAYACHPDAMANLSLMYLEGDYVKKDYKKALFWNEKAYEDAVEKIGEEHPDTLSLLGGLAMICKEAGEYQRSLELAKKCYELKCKVYGEKDPQTLSSLRLLANAYGKVGNYEECYRLHHKSVETYMEISDPDSPNVNLLRALIDLTYAASLAGLTEAYLQIAEKTYNFSCMLLGEDHPNTLSMLNNLAEAYKTNGDCQKALELSEKCYMLSMKTNGEEDPDTLTFLNNLASSYRSVGQLDKFMEAEKRCYELYLGMLGKEHPSTLCAQSNLAEAYRLIGDCQTSLELNEECYELKKKILGKYHPDTLITLYNIAHLYGNLGDYRTSIELFTECYEISKQFIGQAHPDTLDALKSLAVAYQSAGEDDKCLEIFKLYYTIRKEHYGETARDTLTAMNELAKAYSKAGNLDKWIELSVRCYELRKETLGEDHHDTILSLVDLINAFSYLNDTVRCLEMYRVYYKICVKLLGEDHPDTKAVLKKIMELESRLGEG